MGQLQVTPLFLEGAYVLTFALPSTTPAFIAGDRSAHLHDPAPALASASSHGPVLGLGPRVRPGPPSQQLSALPLPCLSSSLSPLGLSIPGPGTSEPLALGLCPHLLLPAPLQLGSPALSPTGTQPRPPPPPGSLPFCVPRQPPCGRLLRAFRRPVWSRSPGLLPQFLTCTPLRRSPHPLHHL